MGAIRWSHEIDYRHMLGFSLEFGLEDDARQAAGAGKSAAIPGAQRLLHQRSREDSPWTQS